MNPLLIHDLLLYISEFCNEEDNIRLCLTNKEFSNNIKNHTSCPLFYHLNEVLFNEWGDMFYDPFSLCIPDVQIFLNKSYYKIWKDKIEIYLKPDCKCEISLKASVPLNNCVYCKVMKYFNDDYLCNFCYPIFTTQLYDDNILHIKTIIRLSGNDWIHPRSVRYIILSGIETFFSPTERSGIIRSASFNFRDPYVSVPTFMISNESKSISNDLFTSGRHYRMSNLITQQTEAKNKREFPLATSNINLSLNRRSLQITALEQMLYHNKLNSRRQFNKNLTTNKYKKLHR